MKISISLAQLSIVLGELSTNLAQAEELILKASHLGSHLILFPELWTSSYDLKQSRLFAEGNHKILENLLTLSSRNQIAIGGTLLLEKDGFIYNTFTLISPNEDQVITYHKLHLFRLMDEDKWLMPGNNITIFNAPWGKTGLAICYDLRFPELFRKYALAGCNLILLPAEWPKRRIEHWKILLQARAIENQLFIAAANSVGKTGGYTYGGNSLVVDPWGNILAQASQEKTQLLTTELDFDLVTNIRQKMPVFQDRRSDIYGDP